MRLTKLSAFRDLVYTPNSAPHLKTLRRRIREGNLPGGTIQAGHYFVDLDEFERQTSAGAAVATLRRDLANELTELERDPLLKGLI